MARPTSTERDCQMDGPDHAASTEPQDFAALVEAIRVVEACLGNGVKEPTNAERKISKVVTKRIVAKINIQKGDFIRTDNICVKRNDTGISAQLWDFVIGKKVDRDYSVDEPILF